MLQWQRRKSPPVGPRRLAVPSLPDSVSHPTGVPNWDSQRFGGSSTFVGLQLVDEDESTLPGLVAFDKWAVVLNIGESSGSHVGHRCKRHVDTSWCAMKTCADKSRQRPAILEHLGIIREEGVSKGPVGVSKGLVTHKGEEARALMAFDVSHGMCMGRRAVKTTETMLSVDVPNIGGII